MVLERAKAECDYEATNVSHKQLRYIALVFIRLLPSMVNLFFPFQLDKKKAKTIQGPTRIGLDC